MIERAATPILPLTGLRGIAALWVVIYHLCRHNVGVETLHPISRSLLMSGYLGVDLFGILSGFVISYNYADTLSLRNASGTARYLWVRVARIYPLHVFTIAAMIGLALASERAPHSSLQDTALQLLLLHGWVQLDTAWNGPSWTVSCEWFCYLCAPLVFPLLLRIERGATAAALGVSSLIGAYYALTALGVSDLHANAGLGLIRIGMEFLSGCLLCIAYRRGFARHTGPAWIGGGAAAAVVVFSAFPNVVAVVVAMWLMVLGVTRQGGLLAGVLARPAVVYLGEISYSIYLIHTPVIAMVQSALRRFALPDFGGFQSVYYLLAIVSASVVTYHAVEDPARRYLRRIAGVPKTQVSLRVAAAETSVEPPRFG